MSQCVLVRSVDPAQIGSLVPGHQRITSVQGVLHHSWLPTALLYLPTSLIDGQYTGPVSAATPAESLIKTLIDQQQGIGDLH